MKDCAGDRHVGSGERLAILELPTAPSLMTAHMEDLLFVVSSLAHWNGAVVIIRDTGLENYPSLLEGTSYKSL